MAIGIVIGDCAAAQPIPLPRPRPAELNAVGAPGELGLKPTRSPAPGPLRLAPDRAVLRPLGKIPGPGDCGGRDIVSGERIFRKKRVPTGISPSATLRCETAEAIVTWVRDD